MKKNSQGAINIILKKFLSTYTSASTPYGHIFQQLALLKMKIILCYNDN